MEQLLTKFYRDLQRKPRIAAQPAFFLTAVLGLLLLVINSRNAADVGCSSPESGLKRTSRPSPFHVTAVLPILNPTDTGLCPRLRRLQLSMMTEVDVQSVIIISQASNPVRQCLGLHSSSAPPQGTVPPEEFEVQKGPTFTVVALDLFRIPHTQFYFGYVAQAVRESSRGTTHYLLLDEGLLWTAGTSLQIKGMLEPLIASDDATRSYGAVQAAFSFDVGPRDHMWNCGYEASIGNSNQRVARYIAKVPNQVCRDPRYSSSQFFKAKKEQGIDYRYSHAQFVAGSVTMIPSRVLRRVVDDISPLGKSQEWPIHPDTYTSASTETCLAIFPLWREKVGEMLLREANNVSFPGRELLQELGRHSFDWEKESYSQAVTILNERENKMSKQRRLNITLDDVMLEAQRLGEQWKKDIHGHNVTHVLHELISTIYHCRFGSPPPGAEPSRATPEEGNAFTMWSVSRFIRKMGLELLVLFPRSASSIPRIQLESWNERFSDWAKPTTLRFPLTDAESERRSVVRQTHVDFTPLHVVWDLYCCRCCGFSEEVASYARGLYRRTNLHLNANPECFCDPESDLYPRLQTNEELVQLRSLPDKTGILLGMEQLRGSTRAFLSSKALASSTHTSGSPSEKPIIWIEHKQPTMWTAPNLKCPLPEILIGRLMNEFSSIDAGWNESVMEHLDEVWVPSEFGRKAFIDAGVPDSMIAIIPESVDTHFFSPDRFRDNKMKLPDDIHQFNHWCNRPIDSSRSTYKFFSNFKWEPRKGWTFLFEAYWNAFKDFPAGSVSLYVLSQLWLYGEEGAHHVGRMIDQLADFTRKAGLGRVEDFPHFCVVSQRLDSYTVARLFGSVDAFVLPTRGEGWGLPSIQAMSMGLPVITTRWGGSMGFLRDSNSFLINLDACEEDSPSSWYGWKLGKKWATPSVDHLKELMTTLFIDQEYGKLVGARARADVVENFSEEVVVDLLQKRLEVVRTKYFRGEYNNSKRRLRKCAP